MASPIGNLIHHNPPPSRPLLSTLHTSALAASSALHSASHNPTLAPLTVPSSVPASANGPPQSSPSTPQSASGQTPQPSRSHANTQSLYQCADCLRRYSRPEHLQRHIATHTLGKRFSCDICSKGFSRADLLKRHRANHQDDNGTKRRRISSSPGAARVAHACQACARARVKCEEMKPCTRCRNRNMSCEHASSEDAAVHLLHLSANARTVDQPQDASPESYYAPPPPPLPPTILGQPHHQEVSPMLPLPGYPSHLDSQPPMQSYSHGHALSGNPPLNEESQLPTPETLMDQGNSDGFQPPYPSAEMVDMAKLPFSDFLRDVLYEHSLSTPVRLAEAQGLAVLDFCADANLDLKDIDFGLLDHWNIDGPHAPLPDMQPGPDGIVDIAAMRSKLVKIWTESPWRWNPEKTDSGFIEQLNLPLPTKDAHGVQMQESGRRIDRVIKERLQTSSRDRILAIVLNTCRNNSIMTRVASSFPSADVMDSWIHIFLASHLCSVSAWIHFGSFSLSAQWPEWLAIAASAGAVLAGTPTTLRRFGFALQEAVRLTIPTSFEENNSKIADIGLVQALMLVQDIGLWSGNRRKMEIAECHLSIPIAMMRYREKFKRSSYPNIAVSPSDEGKVLEEKWKSWYQLESWKRLVFHAYLRDAEVSMTQFVNPSISYAELTLPLPCSKELWFARSAEEFKFRYLEAAAAEGKRPPSVGDLFRDVHLLSANHRRLDVQYAISIYLHGFWSLIWEYRQLSSVYRATTSTGSGFPATAGNETSPNGLLSLRHQELCKLLHTFQQVTYDWHEMLSAQESIVLHLLLMNLHVSLDDLQLFSGKEGEEQARRVYPTLQRWSNSPEARRALWHAGQILRQAKIFPPGHLKDFYAIAVHHAALCLWTHGVVVNASRPSHRSNSHNQNRHHSPALAHHSQQQQQQQQNSPLTASYIPRIALIYLDGPDSSQIQHNYIACGDGRAAIRGPDNSSRDPSSPVVSESLVENPRGCMEIAQDILRSNFINGTETLPPISENIIHLLKQLGNAALAVGSG
ncbi:hypothetical protein B0T22DRAFT_76305 [Podospora appendiculata]|uniref:Uncharacterized protein n=1 Tax=Podospora appendiculata TaxID=314037 RepID=A0AAE1CHK8_9PEZI|nr:hypothetical protein B0T22DRAFT_76305 [Podospora appendiculata]